jgi:phosphatidylcholine synthase
MITLPTILAWTFFAGAAAWQSFDPGQLVLTGLTVTSFYLLCAGVVMQIFPAKTV